tara:strand:+ start:564 stop:1163 length:600 start_codon:yes stop_codon:yes gene_type:complete
MPITINGSGTITGLSAGGLPAGSVTGATLASGVGGKILQVVSSTKTDASTTTTSSWADIAGTDQAGSGSIWCAKITPAATSSKIWVLLNVNANAGDRYCGFKLLRDSTDIAIGDASGSCTRLTFSTFNQDEADDDLLMFNMGQNYIDSPSSTSELTYKLQWRNYSSGTVTTVINRLVSSSTDSWSGRGASTITLVEIAG